MLSGESVAGLADDVGVGSARGVLAVEDPVLCAAVESMEAAWGAVAAVESSMLSDADRRAVMVRMETLSRAMYGTSHTWLTELVDNDGLAVLPERQNPSRLGRLLQIDPAVAGARIKIASKLARRRAMTGERLEPQYPTTAAAHRAGDIDAAHAVVIDKFFKELPAAIDHESKVQSEMLLGNLAKQVAPEQLRVAAGRLHALLDPDGSLEDDKDPLAKCYFRLGKQGSDGLSKGDFVIDAEFRAYLEALLAKLARPGNCNPDEPKPVADDPDETNPVDTTPDSGGARGQGTDPTLFDRSPGNSEPGNSDPGDSEPGGSDSREGGSSENGSGVPGSDEGGPGRSKSDDEPGDDEPGDDEPGDDEPGGGRPGDGGPGGGRPGDGGPGGSGSVGTSHGDSGPGDEGSGSGGPGSGGPDDGGDGGASARDTMASEAEERRAGRDLRSQGRRNHDALKAVLRQMLASGTLGKHRGLPVTAIITMTAKELETASGHAVTGTGSLVNIRDAIRMASHAHHYLAIFDDAGRALYLGRSKRIATADQRIVLIARDRGCSFPCCTRPATWCQTHHLHDWVKGGDTDIDSLTFGCDIHHPLVGDGPNDWATTTTGPDHPQPGRTQWHPPGAVDPNRRGIVNHYHHPQEYLYDEPEDPEP